jgi:hypothetical protein
MFRSQVESDQMCTQQSYRLLANMMCRHLGFQSYFNVPLRSLLFAMKLNQKMRSNLSLAPQMPRSCSERPEA